MTWRRVYHLFSAALLTAGCLWLSVPELDAQQLSRLPNLRALSASLDQEIAARLPVVVPDSAKKVEETYWLEGALIGGVPLGLLSGVLAAGLCNDPDSGASGGPCWDNALLGALVGFAAGGSLGALIGGQFKKAVPDSTES